MSRIMLVDDDRNVLRSLGRTIHFMPTTMLRGEAVVESFEKPEQALARAAECEFDLVIADYLMPTMHGVAFMQKMIDLYPHTPRILLSGFAGILEAMEAVKRIAPVELIAKPWDDVQLRQTIARLLQSRRSPRLVPLSAARLMTSSMSFAAAR
jgi:DNA-binding NtrC family response regulator